MTDDALKLETHKLLFNVRRSVRYHNRRRRFFDRAHLFTSALSVIFSSAAIMTLLGEWGKWWTVGAAAVVTVVSAIDLVVGNARMARLHEGLARRFIELEKRMAVKGTMTEEDIRKLSCLRLEIEKDEPPVLRVLDTLCYNELMRAMGYDPAKFKKVSLLQRTFAQWFDLREHTLGT